MIWVVSDKVKTTKLNIPKGIKSINFAACTAFQNLTEVIIPDSVMTIKSYAFSGCPKVTSINIPDSVIFIDMYAFYNIQHIYYAGSATGAP